MNEVFDIFTFDFQQDEDENNKKIQQYEEEI